MFDKNEKITVYYCKYSDGMGGGCCYYSVTTPLNDRHEVLKEIKIDKHLLELNKNNFDNVDELIEHTLEVQEYADELALIGIKL